MTAQAQLESEDGDCNRPTGAVPDIDEVAGHWVDAADLAHLPSLRNQVGQGHVNADLSSLAWLVMAEASASRRHDSDAAAGDQRERAAKVKAA